MCRWQQWRNHSVVGRSFFIQDAAVLEYDLTPSSSVLQFDYIFASEEYPEYIQQLKNDAIAIFVNGQNIAWVTGTADPVCIYTINEGANDDYYQENPSSPNEVFDLQYDGFTSNSNHPWLTASTSVQVGVPVHIKIVIADEGYVQGLDYLFDSAIFLKPRRTVSCP